ncbi:MAG: IS1634 family transposase [Candidatus Eremiobacteraeota bacterium]|nr:IS1634 family transposase [Candidatus Eremiobacteraeota bacterium]
MKKEYDIMQNTYSFFRKSQLLISTAVGKIINISYFVDIVGLTYYKYLLVYIIGLIILERNPNMTRISKRMRFCVEDSLYRMLNFMTLPLRALSTFLIAYISKTRKTPGYLIIDDTVISKKYSKKIGYTGYAWSSSDNCVVLLWSDGNRKIPVSFLLWRPRSKTKHYKTKLDLSRQLVCDNIEFCRSCDYLVFDSWYCSKKFLSIMKNLGIPCVSRLTRNRNVIFKGQKMKVTDFAKDSFSRVNLPGFGDILLCCVKINKALNYLVSTDPELTFKEVKRRYKSRWVVEEYFRITKQCLGLQACQCRRDKAVVNHITLVFLAYLVLEITSKQLKINHYQAKSKLQDKFYGWKIRYNRDGKKGKKQVVFGLLADEDGDPISIEVFRGNTSDPKTVEAQIDKLKGRFACEHVALVGDKGMIRGPQTMAINEANLNYITGITKAEIRTLLKDEVLQLELFDVDVCEVTETRSGVRYILRRNPTRAEEIARNRRSKIDAVEKKIAKANLHLKEHSRAKAATQIKNLNAYVEKLKIDKYIAIFANESTRTLSLRVDGEKMRDGAKLDGCYVIKTDLPNEAADAKTIHKRYKDLALVEKSFRTMKGMLEVRPIFVRKANRTRAHFFVAMLAYKIERYLRKSWKDLDMTVGEGIRMLSTITGIVLTIGNQRIVRVPDPNSLCLQLLSKINAVLPEILPCKEVYLDTRKKLHQCRKS